MKRTLTFWLLLALVGSAVAQTPTVVEKANANTANSTAKTPAKTASTTKPAEPTSHAKPSPATPKVGASPAQTKVVAAKPAAVTVQPANPKAVAATTAKPMAGPNSKLIPVPSNKTNTVVSAKAVQAPAAKPNSNSTGKPLVAVKPGAQAVPVSGKAVAAAPATRVAVGPKAGVVPAKTGTTNSAATKDPFSAANKNLAKATTAKPQAVPAKAPAAVVAVKDDKTVAEKKPAPRKVNAAGRRDPFISPVVNLGAVGSGCSTGKRCLAIDQILLRGVVKSDNGMIAVVVNAMDKAYFLRENDPVFDGYVVKITGDSIVFKETFHDKLGKPLTKDVTKTISRPVA